VVIESLASRQPQLFGVDLISAFEAFSSAWAGEQTNLDNLQVSGFGLNVACHVV